MWNSWTSARICLGKQGNGITSTQYLELFDSFPTVRRLLKYDGPKLLIARALQELTLERATVVLPNLRSLSSSTGRPIWDDKQASIVARQHSDYPVGVHWE